ncbi:MAG TPA: helix-turn-helix domain-containing protein [Chloroflexota bacterium]|jgi:excisionase family DNA binding protein|nr:helix-turn-helix domain-containing protein [Chloroflexota bacterium]
MDQEYLPLNRAAQYLGVSRVKLSQLVREGTIPYVTTPLDKRVKLFERRALDALKRPRRPQRSTR